MFYTDKWVFLHIPKNAGTSFIKLAMKGRRGEHSRKNFMKRVKSGQYLSEVTGKGQETPFGNKGSPHHNKYSFFEKEEMLGDREVFAFVRNPWSRCLSLYLYTLKHSSEMMFRNHKNLKFVHARLTREGFKGSWMPNGFFDEDNERDNIWGTFRQWNSSDTQRSWLVDSKGELKSAWYKIETDMPEVEKRFGCSMKKRYADTSTTHAAYPEYYDSELQDRIGGLFKEDIVEFDYSF